jgi:amino acid adenylation domain-containing protein/thioester reductase-like protein/non-ribosomal peptide synthase protein (TIGR01720 family)
MNKNIRKMLSSQREGPLKMNNNYYELTHPQKRIWFTEERYEGTAFANNAITVRYMEKIDFPIMARAINLVIKKNEGIRIKLVKTGEDIKVRQYVDPFKEYTPEFLDFSNKSESALNEWLKNKTLQPFDLIESGLFYFSLIKFNSEECGYYMKLHHIISDGWTIFGLLIDEIEQHYELLINNKTPDETPYPSYIKFISQENEYLLSPQASIDREFWHKMLSPLPEEVNLSEKKSNTDSIAANAAYIRVPAELNAKIYEYCKEHNSSVFKLFLPSLAIYISRVTSSNEAVIGSANHNRSSEEQKKMTGMFVSTMPLKIIVDNDISFNDFVQRSAQEVNFIIKNHSKYPFDLLAGELRKKYGVSPDHLLNVSLVGLPPLGDARKKVELVTPDCEPSELAIHILEKQENNDKFIELRWNYQTEKFTLENIEKIHCILCQILSDALSAPDKKISKIGLCPLEEEKTIRETFNNTLCEIPRNITVHELFEKQAELYPANFAVIEDERKLTYKQLNHQANQLAARLRKDGMGPDMPVGILMNNSLDTIVGILSVLKAGGCYVPIDPQYPEERISYMLSDSGAKILLTKKSFYDKFNFSGTVYDLEDKNLFPGNAGNPKVINKPGDLVYIIYTSGTTGKPKGVMIEHHSLINACVNYFNTHGVSAGDNVAKYIAPAFDASVMEIFPSLLAGATLHIIPPSIRLSPEQLKNYFEANHITSAVLPTQMGEQFMLITPNRALRWIEMGGEKLRSFTPQRYVVINGYGPTEYTVETCFFKVDKFYENIPIGKPICNTSIYIVDGFNNLLPIGVAGELGIAGEGISRGYLNQKELTDKKFIENPFEPGKKLYKTGDLARWLPDGNLEFLGRIDRQVKIRGFRIELAEIEQAIKAVEFIKDAVVADHVDENNRPYLCGYYLSDQEIDADKLKKELAKTLPDYMVPPYILKIAEIPLTPHGKVDKKALPRPDKSLLSSGYVAASTDEEKLLARIWKDILKCEQVGVHDNFFSLGGDSIMSIQVVSRARAAGINISAGQIQSHPTIGELLGLAKVLTPKKKETVKSTTGELPLIPVQEWFFEHEFAVADHFNQAFVFTLKKEVKIDIMEKALNILQGHHDGLRLRFKKNGTWHQWYEDAAKTSIKVETVSLSSAIDSDQPEFITKKCSELQAALDITNGPVIRAALFTGHKDHKDRFFIAIHHLCIDMVSWRIIMEDLQNAYVKLASGETPVLAEKTSSYKDWAEGLKNYAAASEAHRDYWLNVLKDGSSLPLKYRESTFADIKEYKISLDAYDTEFLLNSVPAAYNTQINDILLSALLLSFHRCMGVSELLINLEGHGREEVVSDIDLTRTVGWFTSIFPVRLKSPSMADNASIIKSVKEIVRAIPDKGLSYGALRYLSGKKEEFLKHEEKTVAFNYLGQLDGSILDGELFQGAKESSGAFTSSRNGAINLLDINCFVSGGTLIINFGYSVNIWDENRLKNLAGNYIKSLKEIIYHCINPGTKRLTPSDFPLAAVSQSFLDALADPSAVESIYGLSPLQEGLLFHAVSAPDSDQYCTQLCWAYDGNIDADALQNAWNDMFSSNPILRTGFVWENTEKPFQIVYRKVDLPWNVVDLRGRDPQKQEAEIEGVRQKVRRHGIDLGKPPIGFLHLFILDGAKYKFIWTSHHVLLDGWSMPLLLTELHGRYDCLINKKTYDLQQPEPFETYIKWLSTKDKNETIGFWKNYLHDFSAATPLMINRKDRALDIHKSIENLAEHSHLISGDFLRQCQNFVRSHQITLNALLQTAWSVVLSSYSGCDDILYGTTVSGRPPELPGVEKMIGLFINTVPLRVKLNPLEPVADNLKNIQDAIQKTSQFSHISLNKLQALSGITPGDPLFYSLFVFENYPFDQDARENKTVRMNELRSYEKSNYPLNLIVVPGKDLSLRVSYDGDCFCEGVIESMAGHFECALRSIIQNPAGLLKDVEIISEKERTMLLEKFNDTYMDFPRQATVHELIQSQIKVNHDKTAVVYKDKKLSWGELNSRANQIAYKLRKEGVKPDSRVGILLERSCEMIVSILAVLKAGGAYVPIAPEYPAERINYILSDSGSIILITQPHLAEKIKPSIKVMDITDPQLYTGNSENPGIVNKPCDLAYIIYTSGSTGRPKGVMIEHRPLVNLCFNYKKKFSMTENDNVAKYASFGFDASVVEIFPALVSGSAIHIIPEELRLSPAGLNQYFETNQITVAFFPTPFGEQFMLLTNNRSLKFIELGGDKLKVFKKQNYMVINGYGPTECTVCVSEFIIDGEYENIPIGAPIHNTKLYVLDKRQKLMPPGIPGELCVSGAGLARGYLGREELTIEKFVKNPFEPGERMYRTGDLARWLPDGNVEFLGRIDQQVKIRGYRIELGEIEQALKKVKGIKDSAVIDRTDKQGNKYLCAYYISEAGLKTEALQAELSAFLPDYMVPSCYLKIDEIPLTPHGKVDKKALPEPKQAELSAGETYAPPRNEIEEILVRIWKDVLKCDRVGIYDNFFSLGGDSIMSIQVVSRACNEGIHITAAQIMRHPTIAALAPETSEKSAAAVESAPLTGELPLTPVEEWFFEHEFADANHFNQAFLFGLKKEGDKDVIEKTLNALANHHDCLRLRAKKDEKGNWTQRYEEPGKISIPVETIDLCAMPIDKAALFITKKCAEIQSSLDITEGPIIKAALFKGHGDGRDRLFIAIHHLCIDMVSWRIIIEDFHNAYSKIASGQPAVLPAKTSSYRDWAEGLKNYAVSAETRNYWLKTLKDASRLPVEFKDSTFAEMSEYKISLDAGDTELLLNSVPAAYGTQINDILLSSLLLAFHRTYGISDMLINLEGHGREELIAGLGASRTVGWFTSIFPVHLKSPSMAGYDPLIKSVKETLRTIPEKGLSYGMLRYLGDTKDEFKKLESKRVAFNYLGQLDSSILDGELLYGAPESSGAFVSLRNSIFNLMDINCFVSGGTLTISFGFSGKIWTGEDIKKIADNYLRGLRDIIYHCIKPGAKHLTPSDFPLASLSQSFLDALDEHCSLEAIYGLTPLQEGMLFHTIYSPQSDEYSMQLNWHYREEIDEKALARAWKTVISRHTILRTGFAWQNLEKPVQIVRKNVPMPWHQQDWSNISENERKEKLDDYISNDQKRGFDLTKPCLMRFHLIKLSTADYVFIWTSHHIIQDGWSLPVILSEVNHCYRSFIDNKPADLPESPSYEEYIRWFNGTDKSKTKDFWKEYLKEFSAPTPLTIARSGAKPDIHSYMSNIKEIRKDYPGDFAQKCNLFSRTHKITVNALLQMAWAVVLSKYTGQKDVLFGSTVSGRPAELKGVEKMVGLFINAIPVRVRFDEHTGMLPQLLHFHESLQEAADHFMLSLSEMQSFSDIPSASALFYSLFVFQNYPFREAMKAQEKLSPVDMGGFERTNYPLTLLFTMSEGLGLKILYDGNCFDDDSMKRLSGHIYEAASWLMQNPESLVKDAEIISGPEKKMLVHEFNDTDYGYNENILIKEYIEDSVKKYGDKTAVVYLDKRITYRELNERSNSLANLLIEKGVGRGKTAGILIDRSIEMVVAVMAVIKSGGTYIPIDHEYPPARIDYMLKDSRAEILLTKSSLAGKVDFKGAVLSLDDEGLYGGDKNDPASVNEPSDAATIIYTSGSTGNPKGVITEHGGLFHFCLWYKQTRNLTEKDNMTKFVSFGFDVTMWEIFPALMSGATLHIISGDIRLSPYQLNEYFENNDISVSFLPTQFCEQFMALTENSSLRWLDTAGEKLRSYTKRDYTFANCYGPTEYTDCTTWLIVDRNYENIPIGKPIWNTKIYILSDDQKLLPACVPGELCVAGRGMTGGYFGRDDLTESKYVKDPFVPGGKIYRTGDLARWLSDGNIEYLGRIDTQVKIRGFRIELSEIEQTVKKINWVDDAAVIDREDASGRKYLCAYYVPKAKRDFPEAEETDRIKTFMKESLPDYMTPQFIIKIDAIPLTPNGKIDRKALPVPDMSDVKEEFIPPGTDAEHKMVKIWEDILAVKPIGISHNFFELGGHSLKAVVLQSRIQKDFNTTIALKDIFKYPTVRQLSELLEKGGGKVFSIQPAPAMEYYPASSAQTRLFLINQMDGNNITYNTPFIFSIEGPLDPQRFNRAIGALVERHEILRTSFHIIDGRPVQKIHDSIDIKYSYREEDGADIEKTVKGFIKPFSLDQPPLLRLALIKTAPENHILIFDINHIIFDGISFDIFMRELWSGYEGKSLEPLKIQFKDFAVWHENFLKSEEISRQKKYWTDLFAGELPQLNLTTDFPRPSELTFHGKHSLFTIGGVLASGLRSFANQKGTTLFMTLFSAFSLMLSKYTSQEDIIIGTPGAGRTVPDVDSLIGMFVNTLAIRTSPERNTTFVDFVRETEQKILSAYDNQEYQLDMLIEDLGIKRDVSRNPLFDVLFNIVNKKADYPIKDIAIKMLPVEFDVAKFDLVMTVIENENDISFSIEYRDNLFSSETISRMAEHYINLLSDIVTKKDAKLKDIQMIAETEKRKLLGEFNRTGAPYDLHKTIHEMIEECSALYPDNPAVVCKDRKLTYRELNERSAVLSQKLLSSGASGNGIIAIMVSQCLEMIPGIFAILKSGSAFLPIDPSYPPERIEYMLKDAGVNIILTQKHLKEKINFSGSIICLDEKGVFEGAAAVSPKRGQPSDLAYIIYTSGTTGKPKGVMIEHRSLVNLSLFYADLFAITSNDAGSKYAGFSFDAGVGEIFPCLISGAALHIIPDEIRLSPDEINAYFEKNNITSAFLPTQFAEQFMELKENRSLKNLLTGGDKLRVFKKQPYNVINAYGPTEYTMVTTTFKIDRMYDNIPIGRPIANTDIYLIDCDGRLQPVGIPGELCVSGFGLSRGYLNKPELTAEKFVNNPFVEGGKMYRTGDLARWLPDGNIEFMGRMDEQVKIRGYRIELGEIENALKQYPDIETAVVIAREFTKGDKSLCAYYVPVSRKDIPGDDEIDKIKNFLKGSLPEYMVPQFIIKIDAIPLTPNGKVDKKSLPLPDASAIKVEFIPPGTDAERKMAGIWEDILGVTPIGISHNFFELGGHSLKAVALQSRIQKDFNATISLKDIFKYPTVKELSAVLEKSSQKVASIPPAPPMEHYPASSAQKRLLLIDQMEGNNITYNTPIVLSIEGPLDPKKLSGAIDKLVERHEILRTSFHVKDGQPVQKIHEKVFVKRIYRQEKEEDIPEIMNGFVRPFSLSRPPLIRFELIKVARDKHVFMMDSHHIIFDGISYDIFLRELWSEYEGKCLEPVKAQFKDYALWHENLLKSPEIDRQKKYWMDIFKDELPQLNLTTDFTRPPEMSFHGKLGVYKIGADLTARLRKLANQNGTTLFMTLFAAYSLLLSKYAAQEDIIIGTTGSGRTLPDMNSIIGMFVNTLAIRTSPERDKTFEDFLKETEQRILSAYDNQDYQLDMLIDDLSIKRDMSRNALFDVFFSLSNKNEAGSSNELTIKALQLNLGVAKFDLLLAAGETEHGIDLNFEYRDSLFKPETIEAMAEHFVELLEGITRKKETKLKDFQMVSETQKQKLLAEFSGRCAPYNLNKTIHEMIEECAALYPDNTAVVCKGRKLNYGQLNDAAAVLCEKLLSRGIRENGIIAIMVSQRLEMIPGILAILKSGSAFLPIDPSYPSDRIEFMLKDAEAEILLTEKHLAHKVNFEGTVICLDEHGLFEGAPVKFEKRGNPSELAYIIYTSGTTGKPKGVMIEHSSLINLSLFYRDLFSITSDDAGSKYAGFSFDAGIGEIFPALISGAALHIIPEEMRLSPDEINEYFEKNKITFAFLPTQFAEQFMELKENSSLKNLLTGGDKLRVFKKQPYNVINAYGPTEYTMITSTFKIDRMYDNIPIGKPIANSEVYILDADGCLLPAGVPGELYVAGPGLARGYLKRPELTAEKFVNNPFSAGQKMYRTGDLARWLPDGNIEFMGRIDEQVKIRGYRIELGEIEHALKNCDGIKDAVVIARDLGRGDKTLCAYMVAGPEVAIDEVKLILKKSLPEYMVPSYFMNLDSIPLTPNGKTDRKKLPEPEIKKEKKDARTAESETEIKVYEAWKKVLGISDIGMSDNFFALGGHSLKAVALVAELQKDFEIRLNDVFKYQTISDLSANIKRIKDNLKRKLLDLKKQMSAQDLKSDPFAVIANDISAYRTSYKKYAAIGASPKKDYRNILLTGATGFLGSYLLRDILTETGAAVFVPVRGKSEEECLQRLAQKLSYYFGPEFFDKYKDRITVLKSDLSAENLSLDKERYDSLSQKIDCIINPAANVKHYGPYQEFYVSNVKSVDNLIAFALAGRQKDLHHVSTMSVGMGNIENKDAALFTEDTVDIGQDSGNYYVQTKLEGEKLIIKAREKGLTANIYRAGNITFDSRGGKFQENIGSNGFYQTVRAYINLGIVPESFGRVDFSYVDGISRAILSLYNLAGLENENFHIENPEKMDIGKILTAEELGLNVQTMDMPAVIDRLIEHYDHGGFREYIENLMVHMGWMDETGKKKPTAIMTLSEKTDFILTAAGYRWPALSFDAAKGMIYEALKERTGVIKACSIFKDLSGNELCEISAKAGQLYFSDDNPIMQEGAPNDCLYVIAAGAVSISCTSADGWIGTVSIMGKGDFIGEENVFGRKESNVLAEPAAGDVLMFAFKTEDIRKLMTKYPKIFGSFITELNVRIETLRKLIVLMG